MKKTVLTIAVCLMLVIAASIGSFAVIRNEVTKQAAQAAVIIEEPETEAETSGYVVRSGQQVNDGIHTDNLYQRESELEDVMKKISDKTKQ